MAANDIKHNTTTSGRWMLVSQNGFDESLQYDDSYSPTEADLGPEDVLVEVHAASLNYRDIAIAKAGKVAMPLPITPNVTPGSDGAGKILALGSDVARLCPSLVQANGKGGIGQDVVTHLAPHTGSGSEDADAAMPGFEDIGSGLGQKEHGTLCRRGVFHYSALLPMPAGLGYEAAASLTCSGLTAWNALMGVEGRKVKKGDWVLVQGTGGVSIASLQIAKAAGANVVATTSSPSKAARLKRLGAAHVINYRETPDWGLAAREHTPKDDARGGGKPRGFDHVVDVGGALTAPQSLQAVRRDGLVTIAGVLGAAGDAPPEPVDIMAAMWSICMVRGIVLGSRAMFADLLAFVAEHKVGVALDDEDQWFGFDRVKEAYARLSRQEHFAKVVIQIK
ncbi:putative alcohol dehydrogenase [Microdochium trichocladiopsis]|uniref:Alcohol dehydrogenase n=1 Tax=Microdochium trichocladiopsis TaxID=1682393 RepID=A0A9P8YF31_9PEZI|nr:putative alcohol dehydrogenase [Microdochium trichocladiopsis]KAH7037821.1 putative alcohol dehydrogenase [Microdochium trichocladiopsis]